MSGRARLTQARLFIALLAVGVDQLISLVLTGGALMQFRMRMDPPFVT